ncbi:MULTISPECIES: hypothetical protein [Pseudomonas]|uniref:Uncharacterized protein n=1 Tax=Pseudomonas peradeniyensis TaxID=2745488 RepID=A0ABT2VG92_9PSED|nr:MULTISPECIES: hypothetical protein [Pseudomonas]MCU7240771.1 hypothetical protein [Pseudomonas peradeniyensis]MCU7282088.1 hypothetical protein [Pseudomonas peradeniyensis]QZA55127.1 hypothetical protein K2O50_03485 [Pseudomonas sp. 2hn]
MRSSLRVTPRGGLTLPLLAPTAQAAAKGCTAFGQLHSLIGSPGIPLDNSVFTIVWVHGGLSQ